MLLEVKNVDSGYGDVQVLSNVSIHVDAGEIVSIVGANGAGKTTLIRTIMGTLPTKKGEIHFNGQRIDGQEPHMIARSGMAQVMEGRRLFGHMDVEDNLLVGGSFTTIGDQRRDGLARLNSSFAYDPDFRPVVAGAVFAIASEMCGISGLAFALGDKALV